ncbi:unnamed protein product, partial [Callosobruchus maculatus]
SLGGFVKGVKKVWPLVKIVGPKVAKGAWKLIKNSAGKSSGGLKNTTSELERTLPDDVVEQLLRKTGINTESYTRMHRKSSGGLKNTTSELERTLPDDVVEQLLRKTGINTES